MDELQNHIVKKHSSPAHACLFCDIVYVDNFLLQTHILNAHAPDPIVSPIDSINCNICDFTCHSYPDLQNHIALIHSNNQAECGKCDCHKSADEVMKNKTEENYLPSRVSVIQWCNSSTQQMEATKRDSETSNKSQTKKDTWIDCLICKR